MPTAVSYSDLLAEAQRALSSGVDAEPPEDTVQRAVLAIGEVGVRKNLVSRDAGVTDWAKTIFADIEAAARTELCDEKKGTLRDKYADILDGILTPDGIARVASGILAVVQIINPSLAVSSVGVYLATWILKIGLNRWCATPKVL